MSKSEITAQEVGLDPGNHREKDLFGWLIASFLFGKRIQQDIALAAYRVIVEKHGKDTVQKLGVCTHHQLVTMLGEGHYARYDESTATRLVALCKGIEKDYGGKVGQIIKDSADRADLNKRLQAFDGIGPKTAEIFLREVCKD